MNDEDILPESGEENERNDQPPPLNERQPDEGDQEVPYDMSIIQNGVQGRNNEQSKTTGLMSGEFWAKKLDKKGRGIWSRSRAEIVY